DKDVHRTFGRFQLEPELFLDGREDRRTFARWPLDTWRWSGKTEQSFSRELDLHTKHASQTGSVQHGPVQQHRKPERQVSHRHCPAAQNARDIRAGKARVKIRWDKDGRVAAASRC